MSVITLNDDVLVRIITTLPIKDQLQLRGTCKKLRRVCDGDRLWSLLCASGNIGPAAPLVWKTLGQRLSCHTWARGYADSCAMPAKNFVETAQQDRPQHTPRGPKGQWVTVVRSGISYTTYPHAILPIVDTMAASRPLSDHRGNNMATIGLIPIGLVKPCAEADVCEATSAADDAAVSLHKKLFSAMGVTYSGEWEELCEVMRPWRERVSAAATPQQSRPAAPMSTQRTVSDIDTPARRSTAAVSPSGQPNLPVDLSTPSIAVFDTAPHLGPRRVMAMCLSPGKVEDHPNATARLVEVLMTTCSTVVFAAKDAAALHEWMALVSPHMSLVPSPSPFSTADNTPNVVFMTNAPIPSLREVIAQTSTATTSEGGPADVASHPRTMTPSLRLSVTGMVNPTKEVFSWILNRSSCVGEVVFSDESCPLSLKNFYAPAWVAPECSLPVPATAVIRMLLAAGDANGNTDHSLWTREVVQAMCEGQSRQCSSFYEQAMRTEISDANRPLIAFTDLPVPMDPAEMVSIQDHFFYASLRSYAMAVRHACGSDTAMGMALLEEFKKDISTCFRKLWSENITTSRAYCTRLFEGIFYPLHDKYNAETSNGFQDKKGLHTWFSSVTDKISEYIIKAKGPRKMDVLAERITTRTIGGLKNFCLQHPDHPHVRIEDVTLAANEITSYCSKQLTNYHSEQDEVLSVKQRNSAMYTACLGTMWGSESVSEAIKYLSMQGPEYDTWAELLQLKREGFGLTPTAVLSLTVTSVNALPSLGPDYHTDAETDGTVEASETNSVSASEDFQSSSAVSRSRASSSTRGNGSAAAVSTPTVPQQNEGGMFSMLTSFWSRGVAAASPPPLQDEVPNARLPSDDNPRPKGVRRLIHEGRKRLKKEPLPNSVVLTELEVERQGRLQALMRKHAEHKERMETIGKQLNLRTDETADFNVIQRQFSCGFKDYRTTRKMEEAADEIASKLRIMRERVRNSFSATRER